MFCKPNKYSKVLAVYSVICFLLLQIAGYVTRQIVPQSKKFLPLCLWPCAIHRRNNSQTMCQWVQRCLGSCQWQVKLCLVQKYGFHFHQGFWFWPRWFLCIKPSHKS